MSRTSEETTIIDNEVHCTCGKTLAKEDGIKCRCGQKNPAIHFYPGHAISGGSLAQDWQEHIEMARLKGCKICGIKPETQTQEGATQVDQGSHSLAANYTPVPNSLNRLGTSYPLPKFKDPDSTALKGLRVLVISADGAELPEIAVPMDYLRANGAEVKLAGQDWIFQYRDPAAHIVIAQWLADEVCVKADLRISDVNIKDFDALYIPGGAWNPDMLRTDEAALRLVREAYKEGLLIASICHGPQVLISAAFDAPAGQTNFPAKDVHITGVNSIRRDLKNAGFNVHDSEATVFDASANLLTARDPNDLQPFCEHFLELLERQLQ